MVPSSPITYDILGMMMEPFIGQTLNNRYRIIRLLGTGGMGAVYFAHDPVLERNVAIKQLQADPITGQLLAEQIRVQFQREAQILASLHHPNLPRVTDYFTEGKLHYLVMDYIEGQTLQEIVQANPGGLDEVQVLDWADQLLSALEYIHEHHLIHRDIKPSNIRRTPQGRIFLVDFGLVKPYDPNNPRTITMMHGLGTPEYSPPEQYDPQSHTDERSDLYALGATLYHLLTGRAPASVTRRTAEPDSFHAPRTANAQVSPDVEQVILRAMEMERAKRFATAADMHAALQIARQAHSTESAGTIALPPPPSGLVPQPHAPSRRHRIIIMSMIVVGTAALITLAILMNGLKPPPMPTSTPITQPDVKIMLLSGTTAPEYIVIQNAGTRAQDLSGWYLESAVGPQVFNFPAGFTLQAGDSVRIESFTGAVNNPPKTLLWSTDAIWRNAGDKAMLRNQAGAAVSTECYGDACP
jgi:eukaryotic-like serine/threonine-protein kinase